MLWRQGLTTAPNCAKNWIERRNQAGHSKTAGNRKQPFRFSKRLYKLRWRIEAAFNRLKDFRRIATRYGQTGSKLLGLCLSDRRSRYGGFNESRP